MYAHIIEMHGIVRLIEYGAHTVHVSFQKTKDISGRALFCVADPLRRRKGDDDDDDSRAFTFLARPRSSINTHRVIPRLPPSLRTGL